VKTVGNNYVFVNLLRVACLGFMNSHYKAFENT